MSGKKEVKSNGKKKCNCPFLLKGKKLASDDNWALKVINGQHNHPAAQHLEGHSFARRLTKEEVNMLIDLSKSEVKPKNILHTLQNRDIHNVSTMKTIYNARYKYKVVEQAGRSQIQHLMSKLNEHNYIEWHRSHEDTDCITDLFWVHRSTIELLRAFPCVLIMDCTYKTNKYRYPLLEIVGVTSTNLTFCVGFALFQFEREDNYVWALEKLKTIMEDKMLPSVIVTDRELALMNAIRKIFPTAINLLCRWQSIKQSIFFFKV
ncbi:hypothetical protein Dsin_008308 [Dipteronia sinensis]|uniref:MULE transposase domain-containing protein n=1 Tax=Dipteronia sinensis TaxID=43782 RepID=A0AAE0ANX1_9ROSI|nr:hypothetical protein Dsin_008308 [Dipteronia sinensis]